MSNIDWKMGEIFVAFSKNLNFMYLDNMGLFYYRCGDEARCLDPALCCDPQRDPSCERLLECCEPYINANRFFFQLGVDSVENSKKSQNTKREHIVVMIGM